ncbi:MAG: hypothetical protein K8S62_02215 [Candidatus Sabulitectum sp.]|nr:hypothetical protein [Candidatus Sabulitectum sp.]
MIEWAQSDASSPPDTWRSMPAYTLTQLWAKSNGLPDPGIEVERILNDIALSGHRNSNEVLAAKAKKFLISLQDRYQTFTEDAIPHLQAYLPSGTPITGRIIFALFIPAYAFTWIGNDANSIVINLTASFWQWNPDRVFNLLVHEMYHIGVAYHQMGESVTEVSTVEALLENVLWQIQNEGLATYVAYRARPEELGIEDYRLLNNSVEVRARFEMVQCLLTDLRQMDLKRIPEFQKRIWNEGIKSRAFYVVGASMARRIEENKDRSTLIRTIENGAQSFFAEFSATSPSSELRIPVI